jgi:hypothetical protein
MNETAASGEYAGPAEFRVQGGPLIRGQGVIAWDATGGCRIAVDLAPPSVSDGAQHAMSDQPIVQFRLTASDGVFEAARLIVANTHMHMGESFTVQFELATLAGEFTPTGAAGGKYWAAPLVNFVSGAKSRSDETDNHPLRLFSTPVVPAEVPEQQRFHALLVANSKNRLIPFQYEGAPAFIELLPDYKEQAELLESGDKQRRATAVVVGSLGSHPCSATEEVKSWFPFDLLFALSLASGARVNIGFIEIRDDSAQLVKRFHISPTEERYESGFRVINEVVDSGSSGSATALSINAILGITDPDKRRLIRVVIGHLVGAGLLRQSLENSFDHLVRGLEALTKFHRLSSQNLLDGVPAVEQAAVRNHLRAAQTGIQATSQSLRAAGDTGSADRLARIADRAVSADQKETGFGFAVSSLLQKYSLPDEEIVNAYYQSHPRPDSMSWGQVLSAYRGDIIHIGYLQLTHSAALRDVYRYIRHLHDLIVRILLIEIGYTGSYEPTVSKWTNPKPVNWVTASTPAAELGYE